MGKKKETGILTWIIMLIAFGVMFIICLGDIKYIITGKADDVNEMISQGDEPKVRDKVSIELDYVIDWYAELTQTGRRTGRKVTYHCLGVLDDGRVISVSVKKGSKEYDQIDKLIEETWAFYSGETITPPTSVTLTGSVTKINSEISGYYTTALGMLGYTSDDYIKLEIDVTQKRIYSVLMFAISIIMIFVSVISITADIKAEKEKKEARIRALNTPSQPLENDPIFNNQFYNRHNSNESNDMFTDNTNYNDDNDSKDYSSSSSSGFTIKKD